jgi:chemotaxis signal transduction protein
MSGVHVRVRAGGEHYALPVESVTEVAELGDVTPVPGSSQEVLGVRNLRGQVLPVVDLALVFGLEDGSVRERIIVAEEGDRRAGLAVEAVVDVGVVAEPSEEAESTYLTGAALIDGELVGVVNVVAVLDALTPESTEP